MTLDWPYEGAVPLPHDLPRFSQGGSNVSLDFHGDPRLARAVVFSDGNHHMALADALSAFRSKYPEVYDVFYVTTPPRVVIEAMKAGSLALGHLRLSVRPDVFIGPAQVVARLREENYLGPPTPLAASCGNVMLVRKGNPKRIAGVRDLARSDVRVFLSNPVTETASYDIYAGTLRRLAARHGVDAGFLDENPGASSRIVFGECIHHREAPQCLADGHADVAIVFYHLALRYVRIFPELFEFVALAPEGDPAQLINRVSAAQTVASGAWGARLLEFLSSEEVAGVYRSHGLIPARRTPSAPHA